MPVTGALPPTPQSSDAYPPPPLGKVQVGFFSFTEITDPAEHRSYNEWHMLDHMPEQYPLPGVLWGQRWVSTPACRAARAVDGPLLSGMHYLTLYLMGEPLHETLRLFDELGRQLHQLDRFHQHRRALVAGPFRAAGARVAARALVSSAAVPFRPNRGVYVVVDEPGAGTGAAGGDERSELEAAVALPGVAGAWWFTAEADLPGRWRPDARRVTVCYLDEAPLEVAGALAPVLLDGSAATGHTPLFAGPLEAIVPWQWDWFE